MGRMADPVLYEADDRVATLTLNRPERLNTIVPELIDAFDAALARALATARCASIRLRGAGPLLLRRLRHRLGRGDDGARSRQALGPDPRLPDDVALRRLVHVAVALAEAGDRAGARLLRRRRHRLRALLRPDRVRGGLPHRLPARARVGLPHDRDVDLPDRPRALEAPAADRRPVDGRTAVEWGLASEAVPEAELDDAALALAQRVAQLPANQLHMMKLLVNQAFEQMGLHTTQLIGTLLDGSARHTPEGAEFTRSAMEDVGRTIVERDAPFGDYGQEKR